MDINDIRDALLNGRFEFTFHANGAIWDDQISHDEISGSVLNGEIIEDYPDDMPFPSCLVYGSTRSGNPLHTVWGYDPDERFALLITTYRPDSSRWVDWRTRR